MYYFWLVFLNAHLNLTQACEGMILKGFEDYHVHFQEKALSCILNTGSIFLFFNNLFLATPGLCCFMWAFSSCGEWGLLFLAAHGLLTAVASLVAEHRLQGCRLQQLGCMDLVALQHVESSRSRDRTHVLTIGPRGKSLFSFSN